MDRMKTFQLFIVLGVTTGVYHTMSRYAVTYGVVHLETESNATGSLLTESLSECAVFCENQGSGCTMASYDDSTGECTMYHWLNVHRVAILRDSAIVFDTKVIINSQENFLRFSIHDIGYNIAVSEGNALCERFGGVVASLTDMDNAFALGWSSCGCGWLSDGFPYYWMQADDLRIGCDKGYRVDCRWYGPTEFDLFCSFK